MDTSEMRHEVERMRVDLVLPKGKSRELRAFLQGTSRKAGPWVGDLVSKKLEEIAAGGQS